MSEQINQAQEALELVKESQSKKVFNLADAIKGRAYPQRDVTIYLDGEAAHKLHELDERMKLVVEPELFEKLQAEANALAERIKSGAVIFTMRGVNQKAVELVLEQNNAKHNVPKEENPTEYPGWMRDYITTLVGLNIVSVQDAEGNVDDSMFDFDKAEELRLNISMTEWNKLVEAMQILTLAGGYFDELTDAGFLPKS
jgi:hypothetical protein